jgi:hypothetical protein
MVSRITAKASWPNEVIRPDQIARIDIGLGHELVDLDGARRVERDVFQFVLRDLDVAVGIDLVALHDLVRRDLLASVGIDLEVLDPVTSGAVDLIEADLLRVRCRREQCYRTGNEGKAQKALPIGARGHDATPEQNATQRGLKPSG